MLVSKGLLSMVTKLKSPRTNDDDENPATILSSERRDKMMLPPRKHFTLPQTVVRHGMKEAGEPKDSN